MNQSIVRDRSRLCWFSGDLIFLKKPKTIKEQILAEAKVMAGGAKTRLRKLQGMQRQNERIQQNLKAKMAQGERHTKALKQRVGRHERRAVRIAALQKELAGGGKQQVSVSGYTRKNSKTGTPVVVRPYNRMQRKELEELYESGTVKNLKHLGGGVEETYAGIITDGKNTSQIVFKRLEDSSRFNRAENEVAAPAVAEVLGLSEYVPEIARVREGVIGKFNGGATQAKGAVIQFVNHTVDQAVKYDTNKVFKNVGEATVGRLAAFDYLIGNGDRHNKNWLTDGNKTIKLVDHERAFTIDAKRIRSAFGNYLTQRGFADSPKVKDSIGDTWDNKWGDLEKVMKKAGLTNDKIVSAKDRYDELIKAKNLGKSFKELPREFYLYY